MELRCDDTYYSNLCNITRFLLTRKLMDTGKSQGESQQIMQLIPQSWENHAKRFATLRNENNCCNSHVLWYHNEINLSHAL